MLINTTEEIKRLQNRIEELEDCAAEALRTIEKRFGLPIEPSKPSVIPIEKISGFLDVKMRIPVEEYVKVLDREQILVEISELQQKLAILQRRL